MLSPRKNHHARALVVSAVGALALVAVGSVADADATSPAHTITSGTGTVYMTDSYIADMAANNIVMIPQNPISVTAQDTFTTTIWSTSGGDANLRSCTGFVQLAGGTLVRNTATGQQLMLSDIRFDVANDSIDYTLQTQAGPVTIKALDLGGVQWGAIHGKTETYNASKLFVNPAAATALDSALGTSAFVDTNVFGGFTTTVRLSRPDSPSGPVECGADQ